MQHETQGDTTTTDNNSVDMRQLIERLVESDELKKAWNQGAVPRTEDEVESTDLDVTPRLVERLLESDELRAAWEAPIRVVGAEAIRVSES